MLRVYFEPELQPPPVPDASMANVQGFLLLILCQALECSTYETTSEVCRVARQGELIYDTLLLISRQRTIPLETTRFVEYLTLPPSPAYAVYAF